MLTPGTSSSNSATMLPAITTPKNFSDWTSAGNAGSARPGGSAG